MSNPAVRLYRSLGFTDAFTSRTMDLPSDAPTRRGRRNRWLTMDVCFACDQHGENVNARTLAALMAIAALSSTGCSVSDGATAGPSPSATETEHDAPEPTPSSTDEVLGVDWAGGFEISLPNDWSVRDCPGDRLDACVQAGDAMLGDVELLKGYPLDEDQRTQDEEAVLAALAEGFLEHFRDDRAVGCPEFEFAADEVRDASVGGQPAKRAAFSLTDDDGRVVERVVNHFALQGPTYVIVNTDAYVTDGGCLAPSEYDASFAPSDLATFERYLDQLVADSPLPLAPTS